jgi:hypothetical protein
MHQPIYRGKERSQSQGGGGASSSEDAASTPRKLFKQQLKFGETMNLAQIVDSEESPDHVHNGKNAVLSNLSLSQTKFQKW